MVKCDSSFQEKAFPLLQSPMVVSFTPLHPTLGIAHGDFRLLYSCSSMETHFMKFPMNSFCAAVASRGNLELGSECCNRASTLGGHILWVSVAYHFMTEPVLLLDVSTITALTVDWGSSSWAEIWWTDLLTRWRPMMVSHWKSLSSSVSPFYCQCLSMEIAWLCARFYTHVSNGYGWNSRIH